MSQIAKTTGLGLLAAALALAGCAQPKLSQDFGYALKQNVAAQVADPDARYSGTPAPGTDSARVALAQERYQTGKVIRPESIGANDAVKGGNGGENSPMSAK